MKVVVIIPTYNERPNVIPLAQALTTIFGTMRHDMHVLFVDDHSPDGTGDTVRELQRRLANVHLVEGRKAGLGAAYVRGFTYAMDVLHADVVFEMDADFSHKPEDVPRLMREIEQGADLAIGSRYVPGGSIPRDWGAFRKLNSWGGNFVARHIAGIPGVQDCTAGFRAIRVSILRNIDLTRLRVRGYAFQVALLHAAVTDGARVIEVPVDFVDRAHGESKLGLSDVMEFIVNAWWIRVQGWRTFIKFAIVGTSGVLVNLGFFVLLLSLGINKYIASPVAIEVSIFSNFLLNNYWTFRWRKTTDRVRVKGVKFNVVSLASLGVSYSTFLVLSAAWPKLAPEVAQLIGILPAMLVNYFLNSYWTFRPARS